MTSPQDQFRAAEEAFTAAKERAERADSTPEDVDAAGMAKYEVRLALAALTGTNARAYDHGRGPVRGEVDESDLGIPHPPFRNFRPIPGGPVSGEVRERTRNLAG